MGAIDFPTLVIILLAGLYLGAVGFLGDPIGDYVSTETRMLAFKVVGVAAIWQIFRQRWF